MNIRYVCPLCRLDNEFIHIPNVPRNYLPIETYHCAYCGYVIQRHQDGVQCRRIRELKTLSTSHPGTMKE